MLERYVSEPLGDIGTLHVFVLGQNLKIMMYSQLLYAYLFGIVLLFVYLLMLCNVCLYMYNYIHVKIMQTLPI